MENLAGVNFEPWAEQTKRELQRQGLWELIGSQQQSAAKSMPTAVTMKDKQRVERANRIIVDSLEPHVLRDVMMSAPPWNLWKVIEDKYSAEPAGAVMDKAFDLFDCHLNDGEASLPQHLRKFENGVEALEAMGHAIPETVQTMLLLHSLKRSSYKTVVQQVRRTRAIPSKGEVLELLEQHDRAQSHCQGGADSAAPSEFSENAIYAFARAMSSGSSTHTYASDDHTAYATWCGSVHEVKPIPPLQHAPCTCKRHPS